MQKERYPLSKPVQPITLSQKCGLQVDPYEGCKDTKHVSAQNSPPTMNPATESQPVRDANF